MRRCLACASTSRVSSRIWTSLADDGAPSAAGRALAAKMRAFDARLSDADVEVIACGIDALRTTGATLAPKKKRLKNADEPLTAVRIDDDPA